VHPLKLLLTVGTFVFVINPSHCYGGNWARGGGNHVLADAFVAEVTQLLNQFSFATYDQGFNHQASLQSALDNSLITTTLVLTGEDGKPLHDQAGHLLDQRKMLAYSWPGHIELKLDNPKDKTADSYEKLYYLGLPHLHYAIHELFRASGLTHMLTDAKGKFILGDNGKPIEASIDDNFQLSIGKYHLNAFVIERNDIFDNKSYKVASGDGLKKLYCYNLSVDGKTYGHHVADELCHFAYRTRYNKSYKERLCYNIDINGEFYGSPTDDRNCHFGFALGLDPHYHQWHCFNVDMQGNRYGLRVDDEFCNAGNE